MTGEKYWWRRAWKSWVELFLTVRTTILQAPGFYLYFLEMPLSMFSTNVCEQWHFPPSMIGGNMFSGTENRIAYSSGVCQR